jgi:hypothetical protein
MRTTNLTRRRGVRSTAILSAVVLAASGIFATMGTAGAAVTRGGGTNAQEVPNFYKDAQGLALQLCTDANVNRCEAPVDDHIGVYFAAEAGVGPLERAIYGVEAVQNADNPAGAPLVSNGARLRLDGRPSTRYTIKDPWRTRTCRTNALGVGDCRFETNGNFDTVQNGYVTSFLHSVGRNDAAFVGNANLTSRVFGSPTGFNRVRITAPGGRSWTTSRFSLMGQKRDNTAMSMINRESLQLGNGRTADPVQRTIKYSSFGTAGARPTVRKGGQHPAAFAVRDNCATEAPGTSCTITVTFRPAQNVNQNKSAFLRIDDNGLAAPRRVTLRGVGVRR